MNAAESSRDYRRSVPELLRQLSYARGENRELRRRVRDLERSRDRWRSEARAWKWGALR